MSDYQILVIDTMAATDSDYETITDTAIQNTLQEYFKWAKESKIDNFHFKVNYLGEDSYRPRLNVVAEFENEQDMAEFKLLYQWDLPKKTLNLATDFWVYT